MKTLVLAIFLTALLPINAMAATALAMGCSPTGKWAYGYGTNFPSERGAAQEALRRCTAVGGTQCKVIRTLSGGGFLALALEPDQPCGSGPYGYAYNDTKESAVSNAMEFCQQVRGTQCKIAAGWYDAGEGVGSYSGGMPSSPGTGNLFKSPEVRCYTVHNVRVDC
jgi:hypothetical protein